VQRMFIVEFEIQPCAKGVFVDAVVCRKLVNIEIRVNGRSRQDKGSRSVECIDDLGDGRNGLALGQRAGSRLNKIDAIAEAISFIAAEKEYLVLHNRTAGGTSILVHPQRE